MILLLSAQLTVMVLAAFAGAFLARKARLPAVIGEIFMGIIIGPTFLGVLLPSLFASFFPAHPEVAALRGTITRAALFIFLFGAGLEINLPALKQNSRAALWISLSGILIPFSLGLGIVFAFPKLWENHITGSLSHFALFLGTALSISALPVIARILYELKLIQTKIGSIVLSAATVDDLTGWTLFGWLLTQIPAASSADAPHASSSHFIFLSFAAGILISQLLTPKIRERLSWTAVNLIAPIYFVSVGLKVNFLAHFDFPVSLIIFTIACAGKIAGAFLGGWLSKLSLRETLAVGFALNARGAMEIILAAAAYDLGIIHADIFVALVLMALVTTLISGPAIRKILSHPQ